MLVIQSNQCLNNYAHSGDAILVFYSIKNNVFSTTSGISIVLLLRL